MELNEKPNMDKLDDDSEATNVEIPKPKAYPDRSSNSPSKNYKEIAEFNTEKSKTKSENMSSQNTSNNETEFSRQAQALRGLAASTPKKHLCPRTGCKRGATQLVSIRLGGIF